MFPKLLYLLLVIFIQALKEILLLKLKMENYKESMNYTVAIYHYSTLYSSLMEKTDIGLTYFTVLLHPTKKESEIV